MTTLPTVYCDEAGNSGPALLDPQQPVFILASHNYSEDEAKELLQVAISDQGGEPKFSTLRKSNAGTKRLIDFINQLGLSPERIVSTVVHKEYLIVTKIVDAIVEHMAHRDGIDLYERGANIALANLHYYATRTFCNPKAFSGMLQGFVKMIREPTREHINRFYYWIRRVYETSKEEQRSPIAPLLASEQFIDQILEGNPARSIDPALQSFVTHCVIWGDQRLKCEFRMFHDRSKPLYAERDTISAFMDPNVEPAIIGYDRRKFTFPLRARVLEFGDSKESPQLQLADLIAGSVMAWAASKASDLYSDLALDLEGVGIERLVTNSLWPSLAITPEELGTSEVGGINAIDHIAKHLP